VVGSDKLLQSYDFIKGKSVTFCRGATSQYGFKPR